MENPEHKVRASFRLPPVIAIFQGHVDFRKAFYRLITFSLLTGLWHHDRCADCTKRGVDVGHLSGIYRNECRVRLLHGSGADDSRPGPDRGFVFQEFALFPWMTVRENILFPMKQMKIPRPDQTERLQNLPPIEMILIREEQ